MEQDLRSRLSVIQKVTFNLHFWVILFIISLLTFIYYSHIFIISLTDSNWKWLWYLVSTEYRYDINCGLFLIPFIYAAFIFGWKGTLTIWLFSIGIMLPRILYLTPNTVSFVTNIFLLIIPLLVVIIVTLLKRWKDTKELALKEREEERQVYIAQIIRAQEDEQKRISREIHDDTTQRLWIMANRAQYLLTSDLRTDKPDTAAELEDFKNTLLHISDDTRRLSVVLRPGILDDLGPVAAIRWLVDQFSNEDSIKAKVFIEGNQRKLVHEISTQLFCIAQEALNNVRRHAEASQVIVKLEFNSESVKMTIQDNGKGFSSKGINKLSKQGKLGILGIKERVRLLDGILQIKSQLNKGTSISVEFTY